MHPGFPEYRERLGDFIRRAESLSTQDQDAGFRGLALELFRLQFASVEPYRRLCESRRIASSSVADWAAIPAVPAAAFKEFELTSLPPDDRPRVFHSSGTTGQARSRHFHNAASLASYEQSLWPPFRTHLLDGLGPAPRFLILSPPPAETPHSSLAHMFDTVRRQVGEPTSVFLGRATAEGVWEVSADAAERAFTEARASGRPVVVLGTAFSFVQLLGGPDGGEPTSPTVCPRGRFLLPPGSRVMETGGYKGRTRELRRAELLRLMAEGLGVAPGNVVSEYGMSELSSQAYDHVAGQPDPEARVFRFPPWARAVLVSPETGRPVAESETGLIRVLDLANVHSVLAIQTEDLGVRRGEGFELTGRASQAEARGCSLLAR